MLHSRFGVSISERNSSCYVHLSHTLWDVVGAVCECGQSMLRKDLQAHIDSHACYAHPIPLNQVSHVPSDLLTPIKTKEGVRAAVRRASLALEAAVSEGPPNVDALLQSPSSPSKPFQPVVYCLHRDKVGSLVVALSTTLTLLFYCSLHLFRYC